LSNYSIQKTTRNLSNQDNTIVSNTNTIEQILRQTLHHNPL